MGGGVGAGPGGVSGGLGGYGDGVGPGGKLTSLKINSIFIINLV